MDRISIYRLAYLIVFILAFLIGLYVHKYHKSLKILVALLAFGLFIEFIVEINIITGLLSEEFIYNLYIPVEYFLFAFFFHSINDQKYIRKSIIWSFPLFLAIIIMLSEFKEVSVIKLSNHIYIFSGILIIVWSLWTLFIIKPIVGMKFGKHPLFWICTGLIIFYSGSIPFNAMYNYLKETDKNSFDLLSKIIQKGLNIFLYTSIITGFICSHKMKKNNCLND